MANSLGDYKDSMVLIYDDKDNLITKTTVTAHDKKTMVIEISGGLDTVKTGTHVNLLIIHADGAGEFSGIMRKPRFGVCEVALFGERQRKGRATARHLMNIPAVINNLTINNQQTALREPAQIVIENLSTTGILIKSSSFRFEAGHILQIEFNLNGKDVIINGKILREQINPDNTLGYGCRLIFPQE